MTFEEYQQEHFKHLQKQIIMIGWVSCSATLVVELLLFAANLTLGYIKGSVFKYLFIRIAIPSVVNFGSCIFSTIIVYKSKKSEQFKNYAICFSTLFICTAISCVHAYYNFLLFCLLIPMFLSTIFGSKKLLTVITFASVLSTVLASFTYYFEYGDLVVSHRLMSIFCLFILFCIGHLITTALVNSQSKQIDFIYDNSKQQLKLIEELKIEPMSGLYNKVCLEACLKAFTTKYQNNIFAPTCCMIDIDFFKNVNDTYGHQEGDIVLKNLSSIIKKNMGGIRRAFRFGGEEFVILWENEPIEEVYTKVCAIKKDFNDARYDFAPDVSFSFSAGICKLDNSMTADTWFKNADAALYKAKQDGRDRVYIFNATK